MSDLVLEETQLALPSVANGVAIAPLSPVEFNLRQPTADSGDDGDGDGDGDSDADNDTDDDAQSDITVLADGAVPPRSNEGTPKPPTSTPSPRARRSPSPSRSRDSSGSPVRESGRPVDIPPPPCLSPTRSIESSASQPIPPPAAPTKTPPLEEGPRQVAPPPRPAVTPPPPPQNDRPMTPPPPRPQTPEMPPPPPPKAQPGHTPPPPDLIPPKTPRPAVPVDAGVGLDNSDPKQHSPQDSGPREGNDAYSPFQEARPERESKHPHTPGLSRPGSKQQNEFMDIKQPKPIRFSKWELPSPARTPDNADDEDTEHFRRKAKHFPPLPPAAPRASQGEKARASPHDISTQISSIVSKLDYAAVAPRPRSGSPIPDTDATHVIPPALQESIQRQWGTLKGQRDSIYTRRLRLATSRRLLRDLRARVDQADNMFMGLVRSSLVKGRGNAKVPAQLEKAFEEAQTFRSEYHALEVEYESEEVLLDDEEEEMNRTETRFFDLLVRREFLRPKATSDTTVATETDRAKTATPVSLRGITENGPREELHPLYRELMDVMGDYCMTLEEHQELLLEKARVDYDVEQNRRLKRRIDEEDEEFLDEFQSAELRLREDLEHYRSEVLRLRALCNEKGVMRRHIPFRTEYLFYRHFPDENQQDIGEDIDLLSPWNNSDSLFPRLASQREITLSKGAAAVVEVREDSPDAVAEQADDVESRQKQPITSLDQILGKFPRDHTSRYINNWLCKQVEDSPHIAYLFYQSSAVGPFDIMDRFHEEGIDIGNGDKWLEDVMNVWWIDAGNSNHMLKGPLTGKLTNTSSIHVHVQAALDSLSRPNTPRPGDVERSLRQIGRAWTPLKKEAASVRPATALVGVLS